MNSDSTFHSPAPHPPRWPQFSLRSLFWSVALCGVLMAIMAELGPIGSLALAWFLFLGAVHTIANYWGHRLRHQHRNLNPQDGPPAYAVSRQSNATVSFAPTTRLQHNIRFGKGMVIASGVGAFIGGTAGTLTLWLLVRETAGYTGVLLGAISTSVIGGFLGFLAASFLAVFLGAWNQATGELRAVKETGN